MKTILLALLLSFAAMATTITAVTPPDAMLNDLGVSASATFEIGMGTLTLTLENLMSDPTSVIQNLSNFGFVLASRSNPEVTYDLGSLISSSGLERTVLDNGTFSDGSTVSTGWVLAQGQTFTTGDGLLLEVLGTQTAPSHTIIGDPAGSGSYSSANNSIAGNGPHNPFLYGPVVFELTIPGLTQDVFLKEAEFSFGTTAGNIIDVVNVPEPAAFGLIGLGTLFGALLLRRAGRLR